MKNVLILGGTGFIGQYLASSLQKEYKVIIYGRTIQNNRYAFIQRNFADEDDFETLLKENSIDIVFHLVSTTIPKEDTSDIAEELEANVQPTLRLLEAMRKVGTQRLIFVSSGGTVYGHSHGKPHKESDGCAPICGYGMQKLVIEEYLAFYRRRFGMDCRIARLSNPYGVPPKQPRGQGIVPIFLQKLIRGEAITLYGNTIRDFIHIDDAVEALHRYANYSGDTYCINIGSGEPVKILELVKLIEKITGQHFAAIYYEKIRKCDVTENVLDIYNASSTLNWRPKITLEDGIIRTWNELRNFISEEGVGAK